MGKGDGLLQGSVVGNRGAYLVFLSEHVIDCLGYLLIVEGSVVEPYLFITVPVPVLTFEKLWFRFRFQLLKSYGSGSGSGSYF